MNASTVGAVLVIGAALAGAGYFVWRRLRPITLPDGSKVSPSQVRAVEGGLLIGTTYNQGFAVKDGKAIQTLTNTVAIAPKGSRVFSEPRVEISNGKRAGVRGCDGKLYGPAPNKSSAAMLLNPPFNAKFRKAVGCS